MKAILEKIIRLRNPNFNLHKDINTVILISFAWLTFWSLVRGLSLLFYLKNPKMAMLGRAVTFFNSPKIHFGKYLKLGNHVHLSALATDGIYLGDNVDHPGTFIKIGDHVGIGEFAYLGGAGGLQIGDECIIGQYFSCHPENHLSDDLNKSIRHQGVKRNGIKIGKNCWIGAKVTILDGVEIGDGCIIAAGAVVHSSFPNNSVIGGVPARLLKQRI